VDGPFVDPSGDPIVVGAGLAALPKFAFMNSSDCLRMSSPVKIPRAFIFALVARPDAVEIADRKAFAVNCDLKASENVEC
jgi:hypothetical protein